MFRITLAKRMLKRMQVFTRIVIVTSISMCANFDVVCSQSTSMSAAVSSSSTLMSSAATSSSIRATQGRNIPLPLITVTRANDDDGNSAKQKYYRFKLGDQISSRYYFDESIGNVLEKLFLSSSQMIMTDGTRDEPYVYTCNEGQVLEYASVLLVAEVVTSKVADISSSFEKLQKSLPKTFDQEGVSIRSVCEYLYFVASYSELEGKNPGQVEAWNNFMVSIEKFLLHYYKELYNLKVQEPCCLDQIKKELQARDKEYSTRRSIDAQNVLSTRLWNRFMKSLTQLPLTPLIQGSSRVKEHDLKTPPTGGRSGEGSVNSNPGSASTSGEVTSRSGQPDPVLGSMRGWGTQADVRTGMTFQTNTMEMMNEVIVAEDHITELVETGKVAPAAVGQRVAEEVPLLRREGWWLSRLCRQYRKTAILVGLFVAGSLVYGGVRVYQACIG